MKKHKKPLNYFGSAFDKPGSGMNKKYLKTKEGKKDIKREKKRQKKWKKQIKQRGFDDTELWSLDCIISQFILPRLKAFRQLGYSYPSNLETYEEWQKILDKMIIAFEISVEQDMNENNQLDYEIGMNLFAQYHYSLWS